MENEQHLETCLENQSLGADGKPNKDKKVLNPFEELKDEEKGKGKNKIMLEKLKARLKERVDLEVQKRQEIDNAKRGVFEDGKKPSLKLKCINNLVESLKQIINKTFLDLQRQDADALRGSMDVSFDHLNHLTKYVKQHVNPCFPPYYNIYEMIKGIYINCIHEHFLTYHLPNMEKYMLQDATDLENTNAEILLEFYQFLTEIK